MLVNLRTRLMESACFLVFPTPFPSTRLLTARQVVAVGAFPASQGRPQRHHPLSSSFGEQSTTMTPSPPPAQPRLARPSQGHPPRRRRRRRRCLRLLCPFVLASLS
jgi:hypothetical protein